MWFASSIVAATLITLISIFSVYKLFLEKPPPINPQPISENSNSNSNPDDLSPQITQTSAPTPANSISQKASTKPQSSLKSAIGTLTVLQTNTSNQTSTQTAGNSTISGFISLSGTIPANTSIVIVARVNGSSDQYKTVVSGISASNGTTWSWTTAQSGTSYDMMAILKGSSGGVNTDYASSQTYTVTAPASSQTFTINAGSVLSAPSGTITTTCTTHNSNNTWTGTVNFPSVSGGEVYILQIGTSSGGTDIARITQNTQSTTNQTISATLTDSVIYYAQYAVTSAPNPTPAQYSPYSSINSIKCP